MSFDNFRGEEIKDRKIDTFIGLCKGLTADGIINQPEAEFLHTWFSQNPELLDHPLTGIVFERLSNMLKDNYLDDDESKELMSLLKSLNGADSEFGEVAKPSQLPVTNPLPNVKFEGMHFLFTGTFNFGSRKECHQITEDMGGTILKNVTKNLDYLVLGDYVTNAWKHETFGRKIEKAIEYQNNGLQINIITEEYWKKCLDSSSIC